MKTVTAAILRDDRGRILIARRAPGQSNAGMWEFPGGKLEPAETPEAGLARELHEEFGVETAVGAFYAESIYRYAHGCIRLIAYDARITRGEPRPVVHDQLAWVSAAQMHDYTFSPADIPFVDKLQGN